MWSRRGILQSVVVAGAALILGASLAGCGFRPMYGNASTTTASGGASVNGQMAGIRIEPISDRLGQQLHNALRDRFNPLGQPASAAYSLEVNLTLRTYGALAKKDLSASRRNVELNAFYYLKDTSGNLLMADRSVITTGYDEFDDPFNDLSAFEDAQRRGTLELADMITTRVSAFLTPGSVQNTPPAAAAPVEAPAGGAGSPAPMAPATGPGTTNGTTNGTTY